ncbi:hypothetical protein [uncultured Bacteroides sp.]|uniref:hypothetical protein n=1 Tax=uncultured Bacteroides sp. TaxID=162156 RepID=UPI002AA85D8B|nr:hypothetical protein [uncultured Bacteroides sp.]
MKKTIFLFLSFAIFISCNNDKLASMSSGINSEQMTFSYEGKIYSSKVEVNEISGLTWENEEVKSLYDQLQSNSKLCTFIDKNGNISFYDKIEDVININNDSVLVPTSISRATSSDEYMDIYVYLYEGIYYNTILRTVHYMFTQSVVNSSFFEEYEEGNFQPQASSYIIEIEPLIGGNWDETISAVVIFYDEKDYQGSTLVVEVATTGYQRLFQKNLALVSWDNRICGCRMMAAREL